MFVAETGKFAFTSKDIESFGTQTIQFTITGEAENSGLNKDQKKKDESNGNVDIDICFVVNGKNSCDDDTENKSKPSVT